MENPILVSKAITQAKVNPANPIVEKIVQNANHRNIRENKRLLLTASLCLIIQDLLGKMSAAKQIRINHLLIYRISLNTIRKTHLQTKTLANLILLMQRIGWIAIN